MKQASWLIHSLLGMYICSTAGLSGSGFVNPAHPSQQDTLFNVDTSFLFHNIADIDVYISKKHQVLKRKGQSYFDSDTRLLKTIQYDYYRNILIVKFLEHTPSARNKSNMLYLGMVSHDKRISADRITALLKKFPPDCQNSAMAKVVSKHIKQNLIADQPIHIFSENTFYTTSGGQERFITDNSKDKLILFWTSWCSPCRAKNKQLAYKFVSLDTTHVEIIGIGLDEQAQNWKNALLDDKYPWKNLLAKGGFNSRIAQQFNVRSVPTTMLFNTQGKLVKVDPELSYILSHYSNTGK